MNQVFTAGYSGHTAAQLKQAAEALNARVIDIRFSAFSRMPEWNDGALKAVLGWRYYHLPALGNINFKSDGPIKVKDPKLGCDIVEQLLHTNSLILLCGCAQYNSCHRADVSLLLAARGIHTKELAWPEVEKEGTLKCLAVKQPWAWLLANGYKDIENREWATSFRGRFLIHASKGMTKAEYEECFDLCIQLKMEGLSITLPRLDALERGGIVGEAEIVDCVESSESPWFFGQFGFVIANAKPLPFVPYRGALGFFNVPANVLKMKEEEATR